MVAPKSKFIWRRKDAPSAVSSQAGREGGCGVVGRQDLKMAKTRDAVVDITPPFRADPHALRTTLFEGGRMIRARRRRCSPISGLHQARRVIVILINSIFICVSFGLVWACPTKSGRGPLGGAPQPPYKELAELGFREFRILVQKILSCVSW